jgi:hypothetical protein
VLTPLSILDLTLLLLFNLQHCESLLLVHNLPLHAVLSLQLEVLMSLFLFILRLLHLRLFGFFTLRQENSLLHFSFLLISLLGHHVVLSGLLPLLLIQQLEIVDFLQISVHFAYLPFGFSPHCGFSKLRFHLYACECPQSFSRSSFLLA